MMLDTSQERVALLKAGFSGKKIEELYIIRNDIKIVNIPTVFEMVEINAFGNKNPASNQEVTICH